MEAMIAKKASEYSNIEVNKVCDMLDKPKGPFVLFVGKKAGKEKEI